MPCASRLRRGSLDAHPCAFAHARASCARPFGLFRHSLRCSAPRKAPFVPRTRPSLDYATALTWLVIQRLILGPRLPRRGRDGSVRRMTRRMRVSSRTYRDVRQANPGVTSRTRTAPSCERGIPGRRLFGYFFFAVEEKVTRSPKASGSSCF